MVPLKLAASTPLRLSRHPTAPGGLVECVDDRHRRRPPSPSQCSRPSRLCRRKHASLRAGPPPPRRGADHESAPAPEVRLVATRAGGAGSVGSISSWGKRTATPMSARRAVKSDRVNDALDRPPSATQSSTPQPQRRRRREPSVTGDAPRCPRASIPFRGVARCRARARAVVPTTRGRTSRVRRRPARASPHPLVNGADLAALPPQARIAASRPNPSRAERWSPISARPKGTTLCHACRRCLFRPLDLSSREEDSDADVRLSRSRMRLRRRRPWSDAVNASVVDAADAPSSPSVLRFTPVVVVIAAASLVSCARPIICFLSLSRCATLVASYLARSLSQLSSAVCRSTPRGAGCFPRC